MWLTINDLFNEFFKRNMSDLSFLWLVNLQYKQKKFTYDENRLKSTYV